ncbi:unannotated protein [freshwater metagenome]|uniref:Unannotated protein n=1 Tax=freshwater metagenome TaxID=449393 RepID=A0A6J7ADK4_9ZZZZ
MPSLSGCSTFNSTSSTGLPTVVSSSGRPLIANMWSSCERQQIGLTSVWPKICTKRVFGSARSAASSVSGWIGDAPYCNALGCTSASAPADNRMSIIVGTSSANVTPRRPASRHLSMLNQSCGTTPAPTANTV